MLTKPNLFHKREENPILRDPRQPLNQPAGSPAAPESGSSAISSPAAPNSARAENESSVMKSTPEKSPSESRNSQVSSENRLIVGPDVKLKGAEITDCDTLVVEGRVEATMDSRVINIAENGSFSGKVNIDVAEIHGRFDGELVARSRLVVHATGRVSGTIRYGKILIEEGGEVSGDVRAMGAQEAAQSRNAPLDFNKAKAGSSS